MSNYKTCGTKRLRTLFKHTDVSALNVPHVHSVEMQALSETLCKRGNVSCIAYDTHFALTSFRKHFPTTCIRKRTVCDTMILGTRIARKAQAAYADVSTGSTCQILPSRHPS